jgi:hypothetical protein
VIPDKSSACWRQLATGKKTVQTQVLGLQMILKRIQRNLDDAPPESALQAAAEELHTFFIKYEKILDNEIKSL